MPLSTSDGVIGVGTLVDATTWVNLVPLEQGGYITRLKPSELEVLEKPKPAKKVAEEAPVAEIEEEAAEVDPEPAKKTTAKKSTKK